MVSVSGKSIDDDVSLSFVIFYDCCIPQRQFKRMVPELLRFATHIFCVKEFPDAICRSDPALFDAVEKRRAEEFPNAHCFFVTSDRGFVDQVKKRAAFNTTVHIIELAIGSSRNQNWKAARDFVHSICDKYMDDIESIIKRRRR